MTTDRLAADPLLPGLREPGNRVSRRAISYWTTRAAIGGCVVILAEIVLGGTTGFHAIWRAVIVATAVAVAVHALIMPRWRYRVHRWEATPHAVYTQAGWFSQQRRIAPISRIQTVDTERGPIEQLFGLSNVTVTTASAAGPLRIHGLDRDVAQALVDDLSRAVEATDGDAT
jgi:uncharacterized protein